MSHIKIEIELLCNDIELEIEYAFTGNYIAATFQDPAEYPELEIENVSRIIKGETIDLNEMLTDEEHEAIKVIVQEYIDELDPRDL